MPIDLVAEDPGALRSAWERFVGFGQSEERRLARRASHAPWAPELRAARQAKYERFADAVVGENDAWDGPLEVSVRDDGLGQVVQALPFDLASEFALTHTPPVSSLEYDEHTQGLIEKHADGLLLDCGAGSRDRYFENVVNLEIVPYPSTDILAVAARIPLGDATVDAVVCIAVLEHLKRPWVAAAELRRVLKPGGDLYVAVPFLQPLHGYPNHFFNMTGAGLASLFEGFDVQWHEVIDALHPIWALSWILRSWRDGLPGSIAEDFQGMRVVDLIGDPLTYLNQPFVRELPVAKRFELAAGTALMARKPA